ncbi:MAG: DUF2723 domain-containing protein [Candidatus Eisenbacteria bacterium]|uniref:DUF2723 domain-containing protein n=1 Tax=Eiseniibacteriota bacterium TaxID=2212470 RepID=A0A956NFG4_UNCEI|nr:DUF2723 domain-containing protein [Candidatus Eisenbacteria bacterium]MCB9462448.1 DUF2723 domain-containing protein [Candidatus Eisenbacteria bacterium]
MKFRFGSDLLGALIVFLVTQWVFLFTMTIECPFWDSGEFIATSYILGIPHPPGTPLYVIIGRVFAMLPLFDMVATRVNYLSAFASSLAAVFTYLVTVEFYRNWFRNDAAGPRPIIGMMAGFLAAGFTAFGRTFWDNAIEAEVYAFSNLIMALCFWLILKWAQPGDRSRKMGLFILLYYLLCLSMGIHLGTFLVLPGIILFALLTDRRLFGETVPGAMVVAGVVVLLHPGMLPTLGIAIYGSVFGLVLILSLISIGAELTGGKPVHPLFGTKGLLTWCLFVAVLGISTHLYLLIRAQSGVAINEADPGSFASLWKVLIRDQYKPPNPFSFRKASWAVQFGTHFFRYAQDQYDLGWKLRALALWLPYVLGAVGLVGQAIRRQKDAVLMLVTYLITSVGLVFYLNFREDEVRDRDYFFVASFQFFAVWIGLGVAYLLEEVRTMLKNSSPAMQNAAIGMLAVLFFLLPMSRVTAGWYEHDRTRFFVASDFAYNVLDSLQPDAILFTNGDNDTFPLWYMQEVEGFRKDVRVVNLSLLNTEWYLRQLRDLEPKVDHGWSDEQCLMVEEFSALSAYYYQFKKMSREQYAAQLQAAGIRPYVRTLDAALLAKDVATARIIDLYYGKRPLYMALTVPDQMGLDNRLVQEGIVFRIDEPQGTDPRVDGPRSEELLVDAYRYRGILDQNGKHDRSSYLDPNSARLVQNYAASHLSLAQELVRKGRTEEALTMAYRAREISPRASAVNYSLGVLLQRLGRYEDMETLFRSAIESGNITPDTYSFLGLAIELQSRFGEAEKVYEEAVSVFPDDFELRRILFALRWRDLKRYQEAVDVLDSWSRLHPEDSQVRAAISAYRDSANILTGRSPNSP